MRLNVKPSVPLGLGIWKAYVVTAFIIQVSSGVAYGTWDESAYNLFFGGATSVIAGTILLGLTATILGWWKPLIFEKEKSKHRWMLIFPIIMAILALLSLPLVDWGSYELTYFIVSLVILLVGFTEEVTSRGFLLVGLRTRLSEGWVWFITSLLFGLMHGTVLLIGADFLHVLGQMALAFGAGTIFYITRRVTGSLVWAMLLHGLWDFTAFALSHGQVNVFYGVIFALYIALIIAAIICVRFVIKGANEGLKTVNIKA